MEWADWCDCCRDSVGGDLMLCLLSKLESCMSTDGGRSVVAALERRVGGGGGAILTCEELLLSAMLGG